MNTPLSTAAQAIDDGLTRRDVLAGVLAAAPQQASTDAAVELLVRQAAQKEAHYVPMQLEINGVIVGGVVVCVGEEHFERLLLKGWGRKA